MVRYIYTRMPVFMDHIATAGKAEHVRNGINNCKRMEIKKKIRFDLKKTKYMIVKTGKGEEMKQKKQEEYKEQISGNI